MSPEQRVRCAERMRQWWAEHPELREANAARLRARHKDPEFKARLMEGFKKLNSNLPPELRAQRRARCAAIAKLGNLAANTPEVNARRRVLMLEKRRAERDAAWEGLPDLVLRVGIELKVPLDRLTIWLGWSYRALKKRRKDLGI